MSDQSLPLGYAEQPNPPRRPKESDEVVKRAAAELLLPQIIHWLGKDWQVFDRDSYLDDLMRIVNVHDGYEAAKELERRYWSVNAELVDILDGATASYEALHKAIKAWVEANQITPKLALGDRVITKRSGAGWIVAIRTESAEYTVQTEEFLQKREDQRGKTGGYVYAYEDVEPMPEDHAA